MKLENENLALKHHAHLDPATELLGVVRKMENELRVWDRTLEILQNRRLVQDIRTAVKSRHISREKLLKKHGLIDEL